MYNKSHTLECAKRIGYSAAAVVAILNIIVWIYLYWFNVDFLSSHTYGKIIITSIALIVLSLLVAGFAGFMYEEEKLKKDKLIN